MQGLKAFWIFFTFAALLFVAKPFFGFGIHRSRFSPHISHNILVKSFTKRKPEGLDDAEKDMKRIRQRLANPPIVLFSSIAILLLSLFLPLISRLQKITSRFLSDICLALLPPGDTHLLIGKLTI